MRHVFDLSWNGRSWRAFLLAGQSVMTVHLKKLSVGEIAIARNFAGMAGFTLVKNGPVSACHAQSGHAGPKEILDGGSIYWIIKGVMSARQNIIDLAEVQRADGQNIAMRSRAQS